MTRPAYSYEIGTAVATLVRVQTLGSATLSENQRVEPRGRGIRPYSVYTTVVNGLSYGDGFPYTQWEFDIIHNTQLEALLNYLSSAQSATVYIRTRKPDGTYAPYKAIMHRPKQEDAQMTPAYNNFWTDVTIQFTRLEEQAEPAP